LNKNVQSSNYITAKGAQELLPPHSPDVWLFTKMKDYRLWWGQQFANVAGKYITKQSATAHPAHVMYNSV